MHQFLSHNASIFACQIIALSDEEREKYAAEANLDKERYQRELEAGAIPEYRLKQGPVPDVPQRRSKRAADTPTGRDGKRTKPPGPYGGYPGYSPPHPHQGYPPGPSPRGPYYDPYFGYGRPPNMYPPDGPPPGYGYGPPPPGKSVLLASFKQ
jgi:hypothetical protein